MEFIITLKEKAILSRATMPNPNQPNINSQDDSTYSSTKGFGVMAYVDSLDPTSFMSQIS
jgi:hypothetical protein